MKSVDPSESVRIINSGIDSFPTPNHSKSTGKYLDDEKLIKEVKDALTNYIGVNSIKDLRIRIRDNEEKGFSTRVKIQGDEEIKVSEFLDGSFCKDKRISRFTLMTDSGQNGLSCAVNNEGIRCYKVQNGPPVVIMINWQVEDKMCTVEIELGVNCLKIINLNGVTEEEMRNNHKIRIRGKSLVEALQSVQGSGVQYTAANQSNSKGKYLHDEKLIEEVKATLSNYVDKNCIKDVKIRIRDNEAKGYAIRVKIQADEEIKVSEFLDGNFCKDKRISRFTLMIDNGQNGFSCEINDKGVRSYKVQNGPPVVMMINWNVDKKMCTIEIGLDMNSLKIINLNGVNEEELIANQKIRISDKSLIEAVQSVQDSLQLMTPETRVTEWKSSVTAGIYSEIVRQ